MLTGCAFQLVQHGPQLIQGESLVVKINLCSLGFDLRLRGESAPPPVHDNVQSAQIRRVKQQLLPCPHASTCLLKSQTSNDACFALPCTSFEVFKEVKFSGSTKPTVSKGAMQ
eukprot:1156745-Pelagomonas_calceolata.AAC.17